MNRGAQKGFTLVEVLIATFIFAVGVLAVVSLLVSSLRANSLSRATTVATQVVQQQIEVIKSQSFDTTVNAMCGWGVTRTTGFTETCTQNKKVVFTNRTATDVACKYKLTSGDLSSITYDFTMQIVRDYPVADQADMVTGNARWRDWAGTHNVTAVTYVER